MPTEPRQVEVVCEGCGGDGWFAVTVPVCCGRFRPHGDCCGDPEPGQEQEACVRCLGTGRESTTAAPDSLTARMLDLAEAVDRWQDAAVRSINAGNPKASDESLAAHKEFHAALAAYRAHPDYRRPE